MDQFSYTLNNILLGIAAILFINDAIALFIRGRNNRVRQTVGLTTLIWGVMYLLYLLASIKGQVTYPVLSGHSLISSHLFICVMFLCPLQVLCPGWVSFKRLLLFFAPISILLLVYFLGLTITGQHIEGFYTFKDCFASIGRFNVWFRLVFLVCNFVFLFGLLGFLKRRALKYLKWQYENFSDLDCVDISWLRYYRIMMLVIVFCYLFVALWGNVWTVIVHTLVVIISFSILAYKGLFYKCAYAEDCEEPEHVAEVVVEKKEAEDDVVIQASFDRTFDSKLPMYVSRLMAWFENEKPYLHSDFKLMDVAHVLPLNRSYLSRVFNEGFHRNFSEVVRFYRIEHAKKIIEEHPTITLYHVAERCGFTSDTTFIRAFQKVTGKTPKQYKAGLSRSPEDVCL